jgi:hypothetical protein
MSDKKKQHAYLSEVLALPPLKMVMGEVPEPDPSEKHRLFRIFGADKSETDAKNTVSKLIGHLKKSEK